MKMLASIHAPPLDAEAMASVEDLDLWAVRIPGESALEPCASRALAEECAEDVNYILDELDGSRGVRATVVRWPSGAEAHAAALKELERAIRNRDVPMRSVGKGDRA